MLCCIFKNITASAAEKEIASKFERAQETLPISRALEFLDHPRPPTSAQADNTISVECINNLIKQNRHKAVDMRWHRLKDLS